MDGVTIKEPRDKGSGVPLEYYDVTPHDAIAGTFYILKRGHSNVTSIEKLDNRREITITV